MPHVLIQRAHLFGNPSKISARISPDGHLLAWLAPVDHVLNVWVGPSDASQDARPVTNERTRGIRFYRWTYDGRHLVYLQDEQG
ncbi:MAG: S9 family peptidase, partial [Methylocella sp.]